ncbi:Arm DNA-binding domain-containing protein [Lachnospiraceae bacterium 54-53]
MNNIFIFYSFHARPARMKGKIFIPAHYEEKTKTWYVKCYYVDYTGTKRQRKKRGFKLQREAKEWERNFLETQQADLTMTFENFVRIYNEDMKHSLRDHTYVQKQVYH